MAHNMNNFNFQLNQIRKLWELRKGASIVWNDRKINPVGYLNTMVYPFANDNKAKE